MSAEEKSVPEDNVYSEVIAKRIRNIKKKLTQVDELEKKQANGTTLDANQLKKVQEKNSLKAAIDELEYLKTPIREAVTQQKEEEEAAKDQETTSLKALIASFLLTNYLREDGENKKTKIAAKSSQHTPAELTKLASLSKFLIPDDTTSNFAESLNGAYDKVTKLLSSSSDIAYEETSYADLNSSLSSLVSGTVLNVLKGKKGQGQQPQQQQKPKDKVKDDSDGQQKQQQQPQQQQQQQQQKPGKNKKNKQKNLKDGGNNASQSSLVSSPSQSPPLLDIDEPSRKPAVDEDGFETAGPHPSTKGSGGGGGGGGGRNNWKGPDGGNSGGDGGGQGRRGSGESGGGGGGGGGRRAEGQAISQSDLVYYGSASSVSGQ